MEEEMSALEKRSESGLSWNYLPLTLERDSLSQTFTTQILPLVRPAWRDCHVQTKVFTDGITNVLLGFYVSREGSRDQEKEDIVLLRMNGEGTEVFLDRRAEILVMLSLHNANLVPPLYLELANGLCYGYIPGRPFTMDDMQDDVMMQRTARAVARLHAVPVPDTLRSPQPYVWNKIRQFLNTVTGSFTDLHKTQKFQEIFGSLAVVSEEVDALQMELRQSESSLVFCHNDLLCGNLIFDSSTGNVSMVDYEYGGPNLAAYDIGNHFCEFAGVSLERGPYLGSAVRATMMQGSVNR
ncbi:Ethanolamine kinase 2 [Geodia barretti]|uniref:ethanolamine kinase n=1 Tax=Geodia barretti TaxID=519541 RepID=A0AA35X1Z5_GEOBA|nr:Ethanolamine kinase 2 [Geodia barretti]